VRYLLTQTWNQNYERVGVASTDVTTGPCSPDIELSLWIISVAQPRKRSPWFHDRVASSAVSYPVDVSIFVVYIPDHKLAHRLLQAYATVQTHQDSLYIFRNYGRVRWRFVARIFVICGHGNTRDNRHDRTGITLAFLISCLVYCKCTVPARSPYSSIAIGA
jgi:hypothetical protein